MRPLFRDDHLLFRDQVRRFVEERILPHYADWEREGITPTALWRDAGAQGLLCPALPAPYGADGDFGHAVVVIEELARANCLGIGFSIHSDMVAPYLYNLGTPAQKDRWLPAMAAGELIGAIAMTEPGAGSDLKAVRCRARRDGEHYVLNGQKTFITNGVNAGLIIVVASTEPDLGARGLSLFCVEAGLAGLSKGPAMAKIGQHAQDTCELFFDELRVPADCLLGEENAGFEYLGRELARERLAIALRAAAHAEGMLEQTLAYTRERKVFGKRVSDHQHNRFILADARSKLTMLRVFLDDCARQLIEGSLDPVVAAMAKLNASETQGQILDQLLQLHGGYGYSSEYGIGRAWADARALRIFGGTSEIMREIIGRSL
ncbi:acyl-CoA dehydrogenase family protein [Pseudomonas sichuanensis]|uniref:acyl-CoA dehydrogenase family protein n=1 Tax=Pseudomonas sichuanensis TaxID=2213015 RepID=UPI0024499AB6|nr:acyl-CoA dehydrogenase family protein [Pseudomonas sichuanensis]MDH0733470.1 acyl-CoA dehydrogenase family protein [Pseudomonas sichuanensis]MDH1585578.1 acyl-CoA dehydrogenase family protein [Pseudomonas sichuanensis]MDH1594939.1 acyl-CoA dehydrogenase family protein [Pseudomonas sichuanensis]MDH1600271.1 acyl-CoA dehydrogenase family protein [Pseudomonas sichuanensis]